MSRADIATSGTPEVIAVANQKGGVGKTTTTINLGAGLAELGQKVVIIDLDPQGNASTGLGIAPSDRLLTSYDLLTEDVVDPLIVHATQTANVSIIPSTKDLNSADIQLAGRSRRSFLLKSALGRLDFGDTVPDVVLIDCPPSLNLMTVNALVAADAVLVPLQSEFFALEGLSQLMLSIREVRQAANPGLRIEGIVLTMFDRRNNLAQQVEADARATLGDLVFSTVIPRNVRVSEAPSHALSVLDYDSQSKGARAYRALARELMVRRTPIAA